MTDRQALEEWLVLTNKRYREEGISHAARPWKAVSEYSTQFRHSFIMGGTGPDRFIFEWFKQRSKAGSQEVGLHYESGFLYDGCFWSLNIPMGFGSFNLSLPACLGEMPEPLQHELIQETTAESASSRRLLEHWSNCIDYCYGVRDLIDGEIFQGHALARLKSADQDIRAANHLLLVGKANPICARSYRFVAEKLLKAVGWQSGVITSEAEERQTFGHGLKDLAKECGQKTGAHFFHEIPASVSVFPSWRSRYEESVEDQNSLWHAVFLAQSIAADIVRLYSDRDSRSQICPWVADPNLQSPTPPAP
jgi:hypothetical protein